MKVWQLRAYFNSLPMSFDDMEVMYNAGIEPLSGMRALLSVDFLEPCEMLDEPDCIMLHDGRIDEDEEIDRLAKLN